MHFSRGSRESVSGVQLFAWNVNNYITEPHEAHSHSLYAGWQLIQGLGTKECH